MSNWGGGFRAGVVVELKGRRGCDTPTRDRAIRIRPVGWVGGGISFLPAWFVFMCMGGGLQDGIAVKAFFPERKAGQKEREAQEGHRFWAEAERKSAPPLQQGEDPLAGSPGYKEDASPVWAFLLEAPFRAVPL